jgi:uncharacterized protein
MRLVLDTNVVVSALLWDGTPRRLLQAARERQIELVTSAPMLGELTNVLERRKFAKKIAASTFTVDEIVDRYAALAELVRPVPVPRVAPHPDDDMVIGTALAAKANFVVTGDQAMLAMVAYQNVRIIGVSETMQIIGAA